MGAREHGSVGARERGRTGAWAHGSMGARDYLVLVLVLET